MEITEISQNEFESIMLGLRSEDKSIVKKTIKEIGKLKLYGFESDIFAIYQSIKNNPKEWELLKTIFDTFGKLKYKSILSDVEFLINENFPKSLVVSSAASAYVRIKRENINDANPIINLLEFGNTSVCLGALEVLWIDKMNPSMNEVNKIIHIVQYERKDFFEINIAVDSRKDLLKAISIWGVKEKFIQNFIDYCFTVPTLKNEDVVREYSNYYSSLDKDLYKIEIYFEENDTFGTIKKILLCMNDLLGLLNFDNNTQKDELNYYRQQQQIALNSNTPKDNLSIVLSSIKTNSSFFRGERTIINKILLLCFQYPNDDWNKYYILTKIVNNLRDIGCDECNINTIVRNHFGNI